MNKKIEDARDAALAILEPSAKDLEHGMELHANSVVCESYGFSPRSAVDGDAVREASEGGASDAELEDMREEMMMTRCATDEAEREEYMAAWKAAGVTCVVQNAGQENQAPLRLMKRLARYTYVTDMMPGFLNRVTKPDDIVATKEQSKHCMYLMTNGVPLKEDWVSVEEELRYIRIFFQLGARMMHLTYNRRNMIGDGCAETANAGLSDFGRAVIAEMNRVGVIVDCAHSGWQTSLESAQVSEKPAVASHSTCAALNKHIRSKPDEVIQAIADSDGYIGICCVPGFLGLSGDIKAFLDHIDYVAKKFGTDRVAIGTDVAYVSRTNEQETKKVPSRGRRRARWEGFWPPNDPMYDAQWQQPHMRLSMAWTNWPLFTVGLVQRGYSDDDIQKIIGGNVLRVARAVLGE